MKSIIEDVNKSFIYDNRYLFVLTGLKNTILISIFSVLIGAILGTIVAIIIAYNKENEKLKILSMFSKIYVTVIRGTPILLQLMIMYYVVFRSVKDINLIFVASLTFGINSGAYVSEIIKAGINSVDKGQFEAARSLGLGYIQTIKLVILPQAIKNILPAIGNEFVTLIKETSVAGYIGVKELTKASDIIASRTYDYFFPLIVTSLIYLILVLGITKLIKILERKLNGNVRIKKCV